MKVTVFNATKSIHLSVGDHVQIIHDTNLEGYKHDPKILAVFDESGQEQLGVVGSQIGVTVIKGTENNHKLYDEMVKRGLQNEDGYMSIPAKVVDTGKVQFRNGTKKTAYIVKVALPKIEKTPRTMDFELTVRGSIKEYPGKTTVLKGLQEGNQIQLWARKEGDKIILFITEGSEEIKAGVVSKADKGDLDKLAAYLEMLGKRGIAQLAEPISAKGNAYQVSFSIEKETFDDVLAGKIIRTLNEIKRDIIKEGIVAEAELKEIEKYLISNKVPQKHIKKVFESMKLYKDNVASRIPKPKVKYVDTIGLVKKSIVYLNNGKHLRLVGEKGAGKNVLIETLAWIYQRPLYEMALNSQTDKMDILGSKTFETTLDENGIEKTEMSFEKEVLVEAMEVGGFMNLDEINTADPSVLVLLHPIADGRGRLEVPGYGLVEADPNFGLLLTMNHDYIGTTPLNEATRDRFVPLRFPEVPSIAKILATRVPDANPNDIVLADKVYGSIMKLVKDGQLTNDCITNRGFIDALEVAEDLDLMEALIDNVANRIEDEEYRNTVVSIIDDICG